MFLSHPIHRVYLRIWLISFSYCRFISLSERGAVSGRRGRRRAVSHATFLQHIAVQRVHTLSFNTQSALNICMQLKHYIKASGYLFRQLSQPSSFFSMVFSPLKKQCLFDFPIRFMQMKMLSLPYYNGSVRCSNRFKSGSTL